VVIATKLGGRLRRARTSFADAARLENVEGLSADAIRASVRRSRDALGIDRLDLLYAHLDDPSTPLQETVEAFAGLVREGTLGLVGVSNQWTWRVEQARELATRAGIPGYEVLQYHFTYLRPRTDFPGRRSPDGEPGIAGGDLLSYLRAHPALTAVVYSPLLRGAYVRDDKPLGVEY
jgi:aryl-alcohol dehydrogenase-like predicted oxidoreductase